MNRTRGHYLSCPTWADKKAACTCRTIEAAWAKAKGAK